MNLFISYLLKFLDLTSAGRGFGLGYFCVFAAVLELKHIKLTLKRVNFWSRVSTEVETPRSASILLRTEAIWSLFCLRLCSNRGRMSKFLTSLLTSRPSVDWIFWIFFEFFFEFFLFFTRVTLQLCHMLHFDTWHSYEVTRVKNSKKFKKIQKNQKLTRGVDFNIVWSN